MPRRSRTCQPSAAQEISDKTLQAITNIMGPGANSAAASAIAERDRRRAAGEDAVVLWDRNTGVLWVGPRIPEAAR